MTPASRSVLSDNAGSRWEAESVFLESAAVVGIVGQDSSQWRHVPLWFPDLQHKKPGFCVNPLTGALQEIAEAMHGYPELGLPDPPPPGSTL